MREKLEKIVRKLNEYSLHLVRKFNSFYYRRLEKAFPDFEETLGNVDSKYYKFKAVYYRFLRFKGYKV